MPRNWIKAVSEDNGPVPHQDEFRPDQPTLVDVSRLFEGLDVVVVVVFSH